MQKIIRASERYFSDMWSIQSHFLFSFADYYDPRNMNWGALRVFNDDYIAAHTWFPTHPHKHFEIMTIMLSGTITHQDSLWNKEKISPQEIQVTNTWSGISHSEFNEDKEDIQLYQLWFSPLETVPTPHYFTRKFSLKDFENTFCILGNWLDDWHEKDLISPLCVKRWIFDKKVSRDVIFEKGSHFILLYVTFGRIKLINGEVLESKDQLRIEKEEQISLEFLEKTEVLLVESI